jgi:hypothetical protein
MLYATNSHKQQTRKKTDAKTDLLNNLFILFVFSIVFKGGGKSCCTMGEGGRDICMVDNTGLLFHVHHSYSHLSSTLFTEGFQLLSFVFK